MREKGTGRGDLSSSFFLSTYAIRKSTRKKARHWGDTESGGKVSPLPLSSLA